MRVLLIHQAFVSPKDVGGTRHYELARRLINRGHQFSIVASDRSYLTGERTGEGRGLVYEENLEDIRVMRAYTYPSVNRSYIWRVISFLSFMFTSVWAGLKAGRADLVMGTSPPIFQAVSAWFVAALRRRPFLLEVRDLWPEFAIDIGLLKNPVLIFMARCLEKFLYSRATHILVNSPAYRDYLIEKGIPAEKISFIANGVDPTLFEKLYQKHKIREEFDLQGRFVVVYAGALGMANDIQTLLEAAELLQDEKQVHFLIVGDGKERKRLESLTEDMRLKNVTFAGPRPKAEMPEVLAAADVCTATLKDIPMFRTTYPNKVFDYMAAGKPIVLAIDGVIREVVDAAGGGIAVPPSQPQALADAVRSLSNDPEKARQMGEAGREYVKQHFNRDQHASDLADLVDRLAVKKAA